MGNIVDKIGSNPILWLLPFSNNYDTLKSLDPSTIPEASHVEKMAIRKTKTKINQIKVCTELRNKLNEERKKSGKK